LSQIRFDEEGLLVELKKRSTWGEDRALWIGPVDVFFELSNPESIRQVLTVASQSRFASEIVGVERWIPTHENLG